MTEKFTLASRLRFLSMEEAMATPTNPNAHVEPIIGHFWLTDRKKGLVFYKSPNGLLAPQANPNPFLATKINDHYYAGFNFEVVEIKMAWIPTNGDGTYKVEG